MRSIRQFLESAPKTALKSIHERLMGKLGLVSNSRIMQDCQDRALAPDFINPWIHALESWKHEVLGWIILSQDRGLSQPELTLAVGKEFASELAPFLQEACEKLALYRTLTNGVFIYYSFVDHRKLILSEVPEANTSIKHSWYAQGNRILWHLIRFTSLILQNEIRLTQNGELHRRSQTALDALPVLPNHFSAVDTKEEWAMLLQFTTDQGWLCTEESDVYLTQTAWENLEQHPQRLSLQILEWWTTRRLGGDLETIRLLFPASPKPHSLSHAIRSLWAFEPQGQPLSTKKGALSFEHLPRILKELWFLGILELDCSAEKHTALRLTELGMQWIHGTPYGDMRPMLSPASTPNFEILVPASASPAKLLVAATLGEMLSEEEYLRIRISRDSFLRGLSTEIPQTWINSFMEWVHLPNNVKDALHEWSQIRQGSWIKSHTVLRIIDPKRWVELDTFPAFKKHIVESIPNWGFLIDSSKISEVRSLLNHFGLIPPEVRTSSPRTPLLQAPWTQQFVIPHYAKSAPDYELQAAESRTAMVSALVGKSKYTTEFQVLEGNELLKVLRYSMVMEVPIEADYLEALSGSKNRLQQTIQVTRIHNRREPFRMQGTLPSGETLELVLAQIQRVRLTRI